MHLREIPCGDNYQYKLLIASTNEGGSQHDRGSVSHQLGSSQVTIRGSTRGCGAIYILGDDIANVRDALIAICSRVGIP